jgi:hypothetical protein
MQTAEQITSAKKTLDRNKVQIIHDLQWGCVPITILKQTLSQNILTHKPSTVKMYLGLPVLISVLLL